VKVTAAAAKYRAARLAIKSLAPSLKQVGWDIDFPVLRDSDIKGLTDASAPTRSLTSRVQHLVPGQSEGRREITWIWKRLGTLENSDELLQDGTNIYSLQMLLGI
jgi:hypothetical protein